MADQKDPLFYRLLKSYVSWHFHLFYRTEVHGLENIPDNVPIIFIANHQNALMDALAILCTCTRNPYFLARSDVFKNPLIARLLYFLKMLPVFRFRDGYDQLKKNEAIFEKSCEVLASGEALVIMPEGNHDPRKRLRSFKKGLAKIAFSIYEAGYRGPAYIVPVGLDYASHHKVFSKLLIQYGEPLAIQNYLEEHRSDPVKAERKLLEESRERLKSLVIHIEDEEVYNDYVRWISWYEVMHSSDLKPESQKEQFDNQKALVEEINRYRVQYSVQYGQRIEEQKEAESFLLKMGSKGNAPIFGERNFKSCFLGIMQLLFLSPFLIYGWLLWVIPFSLGQILSSRVKDIQFKSSVTFVAELTFYALQTCILTVGLMVVLKSIFPGILFLFSLYPAKKLRVLFHFVFEKVKKCFKTCFIMHFKSRSYRKIREQEKLFSKKLHYY